MNLLATILFTVNNLVFFWAGWHIHTRNTRLPYRWACTICEFNVAANDPAAAARVSEIHRTVIHDDTRGGTQ